MRIQSQHLALEHQVWTTMTFHVVPGASIIILSLFFEFVLNIAWVWDQFFMETTSIKSFEGSIEFGMLNIVR